jgi:hypothetical protein
MKELKAELRSYYATYPYTLAGTYEPKDERGGTFRRRISVQPPRPRFFTLVGDVLHELRSALDQLANELVRQAGNDAGENTVGEINTVPPTPHKRGDKRGKPGPLGIHGKVSERAYEIIEGSQPYRYLDFGGDPNLHPLRVLHELNVIDKHRHVAVQGPKFTNAYFAGDFPMIPFSWSSRTLSVSEHGTEIELVSDDPEVDVHGRATLQIFLHEVAVGVDSEVVQTLDELWSAVANLATKCAEGFTETEEAAQPGSAT